MRMETLLASEPSARGPMFFKFNEQLYDTDKMIVFTTGDAETPLLVAAVELAEFFLISAKGGRLDMARITLDEARELAERFKVDELASLLRRLNGGRGGP